MPLELAVDLAWLSQTSDPEAPMQHNLTDSLQPISTTASQARFSVQLQVGVWVGVEAGGCLAGLLRPNSIQLCKTLVFGLHPSGLQRLLSARPGLHHQPTPERRATRKALGCRQPRPPEHRNRCEGGHPTVTKLKSDPETAK